MEIYKAVCKQLLGPHYGQIKKSLYVCAILYFALYVAEIRVGVAPFILYFTATVFTGGVMWQALSAGKNEESMKGFFMLPFDEKCFSLAYSAGFGVYSIMTKTLLVLVVFYAIGCFHIFQIMVSLLCAWNACAAVAVFYILLRRKRRLTAMVWAVCIVFVILAVRQSMPVFCMALVSSFVAVWYLSSADAYLFYDSKVKKARTQASHGKGSVFIYLLRYLLENKNYLINTLGLWGIACFLPFLFGQMEGGKAMAFGFAVVCLNTPICILLSCDPDLEQAVRCLPRQAIYFCSRYCFVIFMVQMSTCMVYLFSWGYQYGGVGFSDIVTAVLFAFQSAILSVGLEWFVPLRNWKVESDLWHHPRKYIVPLWLMVFAMLIQL